MKNMKRVLVLLVIVATLLCVPAFAAGASVTIGAINVEADFTDTVSVEILEGAESFALTYSGAVENGFYFVTVVRNPLAADLPTESDVLYVNQATAGSNGVTFDNCYPLEIESDESYIYLSGTGMGGLTLVATIEPKSAVLKGDVTGDGRVNMADAVAIRRYLMNSEKYPLAVYDAGDVTGDGRINMADAIGIRRWIINSEQYPFN